MPQKTFIKVGSTWREVTNIWIRVSGVWKQHVVSFRKVSSVWKQCMDYTPPIPVATAASDITDVEFWANHEESVGATGYRIDIAYDNGFTSFVPGYNNYDVGDFLTEIVTAEPSTTYYYRWRAYNDVATSGNSNVIEVTTNA